MVRRLAENKAAIDDASVQGTDFLHTPRPLQLFLPSRMPCRESGRHCGYLGASNAVDHALAKFAAAYARPNDG